MANMITYVAFLRGINVGGNKMVKMEELRNVFASMKFNNVKTLLNSGNVLFETATTNTEALAQRIGEVLKKTFGFEIGVIVRSIEEIRRLAHTDPFKGITVTIQTRLYVTFLPEKSKGYVKIPYESPEKDFTILRVTDSEVCSVLTLSKGAKRRMRCISLRKHLERISLPATGTRLSEF